MDYRLRNLLACARERPHAFYAHAACEMAVALGYVPEAVIRMRTRDKTMQQDKLKSPFPYFGGKSKIAPLVWSRFGDVDNFVEPFFGSGAVLLARPSEPKTETVNDIDALLANFFRALQHDPEQTAYYADQPVNETDLHSRHKWLVNRKPEIVALLETDPEAHDPKAAGWWAWGISCWIGSGWCAASPGVPNVRHLPHVGSAGQGVNPVHALTGTHRAANSDPWQPRPFLSHGGQGVHRKRPHPVSNKGTHSARDAGAARTAKTGELVVQLPSLSSPGRGFNSDGRTGDSGLYAYFAALAARLRRVRVCCGDWSRVLGPSVTFRHGMTAIFLDPPYEQEGRADVYTHEHRIFEDVRAWAIENGDNPLLRIALCGYDFEMPGGWECVQWKATGGYGSQGNGRGRKNAAREVVWFSRACVGASQLSFLEATT